jgi:hypothetical protein
MKKQLTIAIGCLLLMASLAFGQTTQSINLFTSGSTTQTSASFAAGSNFSLDTYATFSGFTGRGLSYWLEVPDALAPYITITGESYFTWTDANQTFFASDTFNQTTGNDSGFMNESRDLGGTSVFSGGVFVQDQSAGTYKVSTLNFSLAANAPAGTYQINTTTAGPGNLSEISDSNNVHHLVSQSTYTLTVVPEPATWSLLGLGGIGSLGLTCLRARRRS